MSQEANPAEQSLFAAGMVMLGRVLSATEVGAHKSGLKKHRPWLVPSP